MLVPKISIFFIMLFFIHYVNGFWLDTFVNFWKIVSCFTCDPDNVAMVFIFMQAELGKVETTRALLRTSWCKRSRPLVAANVGRRLERQRRLDPPGYWLLATLCYVKHDGRTLMIYRSKNMDY